MFENKTGTLDEITELHLKVEKKKVNDLIQDYQFDRERFERRKSKIALLLQAALNDYAEAQKFLSAFGRDLPSIN